MSRYIDFASVVGCRALLDEPKTVRSREPAEGDVASLKDLCVNKIVDGTTLTQLKTMLEVNDTIPGTLVKDLLAVATKLNKSPAKIKLFLSVWPDKTFKLADVNSSFVSVDSRSSMVRQSECFESLARFSKKLTDFISVLSDISQWGKSCQIQTFDFSGFPIGKAEVQALSVLSRLKIPEDWQHITRTAIVDVSFEMTDSEMVMVMLKRTHFQSQKKREKTLFKVNVSRAFFNRPISQDTLSEIWPLLGCTSLKGLSLRYAYITGDVLREDFPGMIRFENLTCLDLSSSIIDLSGQQKSPSRKLTLTAQAVEAINYVVKNLKKLNRLDLADLVLTNQLSSLFQDVSNSFVYLNLSGCRLSTNDLRFLSHFSGELTDLQELNLGHNNLSRSTERVCQVVKNSLQLRILNLGYSDFETGHAERVVDVIVRHLGSLECFKISARPPKIALNSTSIVRPLMMMPKMLKLALPIPEPHPYDDLSPAMGRMIAELQRERRLRTWPQVAFKWVNSWQA